MLISKPIINRVNHITVANCFKSFVKYRTEHLIVFVYLNDYCQLVVNIDVSSSIFKLSSIF